MQQPVKHIGCRWSHGGFTSSLHVHPVMSQQIYILAALHIAPSAVGVLFDWSVLALEALCLLTLSVKGVKKRSCMLLSLTSFAMFWLSDLHPAKVFVNKVSTSDPTHLLRGVFLVKKKTILKITLWVIIGGGLSTCVQTNKTGRTYYAHNYALFFYWEIFCWIYVPLYQRIKDVLESSHNHICQNTLQSPNSVHLRFSCLGLNYTSLNTTKHRVFCKYNMSTLWGMI